MTRLNRRGFLRGAGALSMASTAGLLGVLANQSAFAANTSGYKALVCIFLYGGMDQFDTVLPVDEPSYSAFRGHRAPFLDLYNLEPGGSSRVRDALLDLAADNIDAFGGRRFGLPRQLRPLHSMFEAGELAVVGNVGPLIEPVTRDTIDDRSRRIPERLFSHNDQQSTWMSLGTEGTQFGWGGQFADRAWRSSTSDNRFFSTMSTLGHQVFLSGEDIRPYAVPVFGSSGVSLLGDEWLLGYGDGPDRARRLLEEHLRGEGLDTSSLLRRDVIDIGDRAIEIDRQYGSARAFLLEVQTPVPDGNWLAYQLRTVAETISMRQHLNVSRQVFFVGAGGYDTHSAQAGNLPRLHSELASAMAFFNTALKEVNAFNNVVTFTASEFGRTLLINGDGSDHGWGGHQFVMGGPVQGRRIFGGVSDYEVGSQAYWDQGGRPIPDVSVDQFAATLGRWFGLTTGELADIFPNLRNFDTPDLGFV